MRYEYHSLCFIMYVKIDNFFFKQVISHVRSYAFYSMYLIELQAAATAKTDYRSTRRIFLDSQISLDIKHVVISFNFL